MAAGTDAVGTDAVSRDAAVPIDTPGSDLLVLIAARTARSTEAADWARALGETVSSAGGTLWELANAAPAGGPGPGHSHVVRFDAHAAVDDYDRAIETARRDGALFHGHAETRRDVWRRHRPTIGDATGHALTALIAAEVMCIDPARAAEWDRWYDEQHLPDMMSSDAFVTGSRWRRDPIRPGGTNDLTLYEIAGSTLDEAVERSGVVMHELIAAGRKHECHTGGLTMALTRAG